MSLFKKNKINRGYNLLKITIKFNLKYNDLKLMSETIYLKTILNYLIIYIFIFIIIIFNDFC